MLGALKQKHILLAGDFFLDRYLKGSVERISPEAPVPVIDVKEEWFLPGGAGNVALNLCAMGATVRLFGRVGEDINGRALVELLISRGIDTSMLLSEAHYSTGIKTRLIAASQQMLRIDQEILIPTQVEFTNWEAMFEGIDLLVISDYGKGFLTERHLQKLIQLGRASNIPVIVDPKGVNFNRYSRATLIKPNEKEAYLAAGMSPKEPLEKAAAHLLKESSADAILVTRSGKGMSLYTPSAVLEASVAVKDIVDVTGAGDTVLSMLAIALANQFDMATAMRLANVAASIAIEHVGCYAVTLKEVSARLLQQIGSDGLITTQDLALLKMQLVPHETSLIRIGALSDVTLAVYELLHQFQHRRNHRQWILGIDNGGEMPHLLDLLRRSMPGSYLIDENASSSLIAEGMVHEIFDLEEIAATHGDV